MPGKAARRGYFYGRGARRQVVQVHCDPDSVVHSTVHKVEHSFGRRPYSRNSSVHKVARYDQKKGMTNHKDSPCLFEEQANGCMRRNCPFIHRRSRRTPSPSPSPSPSRSPEEWRSSRQQRSSTPSSAEDRWSHAERFSTTMMDPGTTSPLREEREQLHQSDTVTTRPMREEEFYRLNSSLLELELEDFLAYLMKKGGKAAGGESSQDSGHLQGATTTTTSNGLTIKSS